MIGPRIRDAVPADAEALLAIYRPFVIDTAVSFELEPPSASELLLRIASAQSRWAWLVAERDARVLGYAYASAFRSRAAYQWSVETSAYLHPEHRGQGVGAALYEKLLAVLPETDQVVSEAGVSRPGERESPSAKQMTSG